MAAAARGAAARATIVPWAVTADPAKNPPVAYAKDIHLSLPANVGVSFIASVPDRDARFLAAGIHAGPKQNWTLIDLTTGKSTPSLSAKMWLSDDVLISPDGQYLAATGIDESVGSGESFQVWSLKENKQIVDIKHKAGNDAPDYAI